MKGLNKGQRRKIYFKMIFYFLKGKGTGFCMFLSGEPGFNRFHLILLTELMSFKPKIFYQNPYFGESGYWFDPHKTFDFTRAKIAFKSWLLTFK